MVDCSVKYPKPVVNHAWDLAIPSKSDAERFAVWLGYVALYWASVDGNVCKLVKTLYIARNENEMSSKLNADCDFTYTPLHSG